MRVVVVIYPVPAQSVFCVVCFFLFFLLQFTQKFFGELVLFHLARTPTKPARKIFSRKKRRETS